MRQRVRVICLGFLSGYGLPVILLFSSGITGGEVPVNYMAFTGFLFPMSLGYAIVKHDLFDIDALIKRAAYYLALTTILTLAYIALLAVLNLLLHASDLTRSPCSHLALPLPSCCSSIPSKNSYKACSTACFFAYAIILRKFLSKPEVCWFRPCPSARFCPYCGTPFVTPLVSSTAAFFCRPRIAANMFQCTRAKENSDLFPNRLSRQYGTATKPCTHYI